MTVESSKNYRLVLCYAQLDNLPSSGIFTFQVQYIDFEGRSDGESLLKILSQMRPRRVVVVGAPAESVAVVARHCEQNIGARVFAPGKGDTVDATTETHIYQVRLTEALIAQLQFQRARGDTEVAWIDAQVAVRSKQLDAATTTGTATETEEKRGAGTGGAGMDVDEEEDGEDGGEDGEGAVKREPETELTLVPVADAAAVSAHAAVLINELKLSDFKLVLQRNNISSELSGGVLLCANGSCAIRRVDTGRVTMEGCVSEVYFKIRELLYEQYAMI